MIREDVRTWTEVEKYVDRVRTRNPGSSLQWRNLPDGTDGFIRGRFLQVGNRVSSGGIGTQVQTSKSMDVS